MTMINTLAQIGDQRVANALAAKYPAFADRDKNGRPQRHADVEVPPVPQVRGGGTLQE